MRSNKELIIKWKKINIEQIDMCCQKKNTPPYKPNVKTSQKFDV